MYVDVCECVMLLTDKNIISNNNNNDNGGKGREERYDCVHYARCISTDRHVTYENSRFQGHKIFPTRHDAITYSSLCHLY